MFKTAFLFLTLVFLQAGIPFFALGQSNTSETLTISTYYPSPYGVYRNLEVKRGLAVGGSGYDTVNNLEDGQLYINSSVILNSLKTYPPSPWHAGQLIYYVGAGEKTLKYYNGTQWINFTGSATSVPTCGSSNAQTLGSAPTTNLCDVGTNSTVGGGSGPWTWTCTQGTNTTNCIAIPNNLPEAICGASNGATLTAAPTTDLCIVGTPTTPSGSGPWIWSCKNGTYSCPCIANSAAIPSAICGSSNGQLFTSAPATNLCAIGTPSTPSGSGPWLWNCTTAAGSCPCIAGLLTPPACGTSNGQTLKSAPTTNLCAIGTNTTVTGTGPWTWKCQNSAGSKNCQANVCVKQPHYPAKKCGARTYSDGWHPGCGSWYVANSCTTRETWGVSDTCVFQSLCLWTAKLACTLYSCSESCTNDWDGTYSCPP